MSKLLKTVGFLSLLILTAVPLQSADYAYTFTKMGDFSPVAINNAGQVGGTAYSSGQQAVLYDHGNLINLGSMGKTNSYPVDINDDGQIVGYAYNSGSDYRAFLYSDGEIKDLNSLINPDSGLTLNEADGITNQGVIVGTCSTVTESKHVLLYSNGNLNDLGILGLNNAFDAINDSGQIIGIYTTSIGYFQGFTFSNGTRTDIGSLAGFDTYALGINSSGHIFGNSISINGYAHAYLYSNGKMTDIDPNGRSRTANAINDLGQIVGNDSNNHAFLYQNATTYDLNTMIDPSLEITLVNGVGINNSGQILLMDMINTYIAIHLFYLQSICLNHQ